MDVVGFFYVEKVCIYVVINIRTCVCMYIYATQTGVKIPRAGVILCVCVVFSLSVLLNNW